MPDTPAASPNRAVTLRLQFSTISVKDVTMATQWCFGPFRFEPDNACMWRGEQMISLTPKAFAILQYLVEHAGRLVTKEVLLEAIWPETAVSDGVLKVRIDEIRK